MVDPESESSNKPVHVLQTDRSTLQPDPGILRGGHAPTQVPQHGARHHHRSVFFDPVVLVDRGQLHRVPDPGGEGESAENRPPQKGLAPGSVDDRQDRNPPRRPSAGPCRHEDDGQKESGGPPPLSPGKMPAADPHGLYFRIPFSLKYLAAPGWRGRDIPFNAVSRVMLFP